MMVLQARAPMPKKPGPPRDDKAVKIERDLAVKAGVIAEQFGFDSIAEYLSALLRPPIEKDWPEALKRLESSRPKSEKKHS